MNKIKQDAIELVGYFQNVVYPFIGSSMLVNTPWGLTILDNSKFCAKKVVDNTIEELKQYTDSYPYEIIKYWEDVLSAINEVTCADIGIEEGYIR